MSRPALRPSSPSEAPPLKGSTIYWTCTTSWGPSIQRHDPTGDIQTTTKGKGMFVSSGLNIKLENSSLFQDLEGYQRSLMNADIVTSQQLAWINLDYSEEWVGEKGMMWDIEWSLRLHSRLPWQPGTSVRMQAQEIRQHPFYRFTHRHWAEKLSTHHVPDPGIPKQVCAAQGSEHHHYTSWVELVTTDP